MSSKAESEVHWWINSIDNSCHHINNISNPDITIRTDASLTGWGITNGISPSRGLQQKPELHHNNVLESKAIDTVIYTYCKEKISVHVRVMCDNVTAIAYVNTMGGIKSEPGNNIACRIWNFCIENKFLVSAAHIPSKNNVEADQQSRILQDATEWKLHPGLFPKIVDNFFFNMNCFSSSINTMIQYKDS